MSMNVWCRRYRLKINGPPELRPKVSREPVQFSPRCFGFAHNSTKPRPQEQIDPITVDPQRGPKSLLNRTLISGIYLTPVKNNPTKLMSPWASPGYKLMKHLWSIYDLFCPTHTSIEMENYLFKKFNLKNKIIKKIHKFDSFIFLMLLTESMKQYQFFN